MPARGPKTLPAAARKKASGGPGAQRSEPGARQLKTLAKALGNAQVQAVVGRSDHQRDALYQFILARLQRVQTVQTRERAAMAGHRTWFDEVAHRKAGFTLPDPTRWRRVAEAYRHAAEALGRGNLGLAAQHVERAMAAEQEAMAHLPEQVRLDQRDTAGAAAPDLQVPAGAGCTPREIRAAVALAETIERASDRSEAEGLPRVRKPWWNQEPEAEEEQKPEEGKKTAGDAAGSGSALASGSPAKDDARDVARDERREVAGDETREVARDESRELARDEARTPAAAPAPPVRQVRTGVRRGKP